MTVAPKIHQVDPEAPDAAIIEAAARIIQNGDVVAFPTRCLYGLAADARNRDAVEKVYRIKGRQADNPILILVESAADVPRFVVNVPDAAQRLMHRFWPGMLTLVFSVGPALPSMLTGGTGKIGIRVPGHPVADALVRAAGGPITGTSANISGQPGADRIAGFAPELAVELDLILDAGTLRGGQGSTVVDMTVSPPKILRVGEISAEEIDAVLENS